ncbi:glycerol kinase-like isoform X1 [Daphnia pulex]|uniref:glycerol kinase-like isoform X1 n=1 Tax=Daphnia pulex TaxID=6669 RepID=UPI001EDDA654|nr:glycerol kinase-like isoform X1 [Daphnia pulex]XP_046456346.1 glycerol kinase-like isoform X1 [Daphnia pulex]XP_046456347.1 glycerol kinase-like isoform X1 [Daphnia pulex]
MVGKYGPLIGAIDQGTSSSRFLVFSAERAELITYHQVEVNQLTPQEGWVESDPMELLQTVIDCVCKTVENLKSLDVDPGDIKAIGVCNQRETTIVWDKLTGKPLYNAIIWLDARTKSTVESMLSKVQGGNKDFLKRHCGLPISTYFSALKLRWLIDNVAEVSDAIDENRCLFGTVDTWLIWNLTGGVKGGLHLTDVTNASRTMLMNLETLNWDPYLLKFFNIPTSILPEIRSSSEIYGFLTSTPLGGTPISGCLGDQQSALIGQLCLEPGQAKMTYGTGGFLLYNTGIVPVQSEHGLITTVAYQMGKNKQPHYAMEGSIAVAGLALNWLKNNLNLISDFQECEKLASSVTTTGGVYFVPAFSGLYAPYWRMDARGVVCGLTQFTTRAHLARATLESVCYQTKDIVEVMTRDAGAHMTSLRVDGGMTQNNLLIQLQADILGIPIVRPTMTETTALGAAMAAGNAEGIDVWSLDSLDQNSITSDTFTPAVSESDRGSRYTRWKDAVKRTLGWETILDDGIADPERRNRMLGSISGTVFLFSSFLILVAARHYRSTLR